MQGFQTLKKGFKTCVKRCMFGAREIRNGKSFVKENCYGCGLCVTTCPPTGPLNSLLGKKQ